MRAKDADQFADGLISESILTKFNSKFGSDYFLIASYCYIAYGFQRAAAKQKCLAHRKRDLEALKTRQFVSN